MKRISWLSLPIIIVGLSSCALLKRHTNSGYYGADTMEPSPAVDFYQLKQAHEHQEVLEELGFSPTRALGEPEQFAIEQRLRLKRMEEQIPTKREKQQYYRYKAFLPSDLARIAFLQVPTVEARERWIQKLGISDDETNGYSEEMAQLIEGNEIIVGMGPRAVTESWGDPDVVEVAGNPLYKNERWKYSKYVSSEDGYRREMRIIYFEGGRVVGWETL